VLHSAWRRKAEAAGEGVAASMIKNDLEWASENRERILAEWARRYTKAK
jgi:hypothetical protein